MCGVNKQWQICARRLIEAVRRQNLPYLTNERIAELNGGKVIFNVIYRPKHLSVATHLQHAYGGGGLMVVNNPQHINAILRDDSMIPPEGILLIQRVTLYDAVEGAFKRSYTPEMIRYAHWEVVVPPKARIGTEFIQVANALNVAPARPVGRLSVRIEHNGKSITGVKAYCIQSDAGWKKVPRYSDEGLPFLLPPDEASKVESYLGNRLAVATVTGPDRCNEFLGTFLR